MSAFADAARAPVLVAATVAAGLQAGTYYTWACGVMPGLARVDDRTFVTAMQQVNAAIVNPVFMLSFVGAPVLAGIAAVTGSGQARPWLLAALAFSVATVVVTVGGNVPLNDPLEAAAGAGSGADPSGVRAAFEDPWVRWNVLRAVTSTGSLASLAWAGWRS